MLLRGNKEGYSLYKQLLINDKFYKVYTTRIKNILYYELVFIDADNSYHFGLYVNPRFAINYAKSYNNYLLMRKNTDNVMVE